MSKLWILCLCACMVAFVGCGKNMAICDILGAWEQAKMAEGDIVLAD